MNRLLVALVLAAILGTSCSSVPTFTSSDLPSTMKVTDQGSWLVAEPTAGTTRTVGIVFYPGGLVKPEAYLVALSPIVAAGYPVVIVKMPFDLAFFDADKGLAARKAVPGVTRWVIGGHSLGGVASAMAVDKHRDAFAGIVFWASYPAKDNDLSKCSVPALSITADHDGLSTPAKVAAAAPLLPPNTTKVVIEGGNHGQFGTYGPQKGDGQALISREAQQAQAATAVLTFLGTL